MSARDRAASPATGSDGARDAVDVALRDGRTLRIRAAEPADEPALRDFFARLDPEDRALRFFTAGADLARAARVAATADRRTRWSLVAVGPDDRTVLGHGVAVADGRGQADVAFAVDRRVRGGGVATAMLALLAEQVGAQGVARLTADVLPDNHAMIDVFRQSGLEPSIEVRDGVLHVTMPAELGPTARARYDERMAEASAAGVASVLCPRSVAVLGASDRPGSIGGAVLRNLLAGGFRGDVHVVNRRGGTIGGLPALRSVDELPNGVDLVVVAIPASGVVDAARRCAARGVRALVVLSDGFAEAGAEGRARQRALVEVCRAAGMRLVGPNCLGVLNTDPDVALDVTFAPQRPPRGHVAFLSQSGALGIAAIDVAREQGLGISSFVSVGDKADLSGNDFLAFWERDADTDVILLYLESFGNPRRFGRIARRVARRKPIVAVKGGRSRAGARAAGSHTGALMAASDTTVQALLRQAGVIAAETLGELFDVAALLSAHPAPRGTRVGIVTNGGGLGILCADACATAGLEVVALDEALRRELAAGVGADAVVDNPIDLLAAATPDHFAHAVGRLGASGAVDAVIAIYVPPMVSEPREVAAAIATGADAARAAGVPVVAVMAMADAPTDALARGAGRVPAFRFPEDAARALARAALYGAWRERDDAPPAPPADADAPAAAAALARALERGPGWLAPDELATVLDAYRIRRPAQRTVGSARAAGAAARELGRPVALKAIADGLVHRTDAQAVALDLRSPSAVVAEARRMRRRVERAGYEVTGFLVQEMAPTGVELLVGVVADPEFGPVVAVAAGGTRAELLADTAVRIAPLSARDAREMVRALRTFPLLEGYRGAPRCDVAALERVLLALAALGEAHPEIAEFECNPLIVGPDGAVAVDARARVAPPPPRLPEVALRPA